MFPLILTISSSSLGVSPSVPDGTFYELDTKLYSFHKAVLYLLQHPKQAKRCKKCRKYFMHVHGMREYCEYLDSRGERCREESDKKRKRVYYHTTGKKKRQAKKKRKSTPRLPRAGRRKLTAKS